MDDTDLERVRESLFRVESDLRSGIRALTEGSCSRAACLLRELGDELTIRHPRTHQELPVRLEGVTLGYEEELLFELAWFDVDGSSRRLTLNLAELMDSLISVQNEPV